MNIIHDGLYTDDNINLLNKTKKVIKMAIKTTAYTAFLGIAIASSLHLYNNPQDRAAVKQGLSQIGNGIEGKINSSAIDLTGHNVTSQMTKVSNFVEKKVHNSVETVKQSTPTQNDAKELITKIKTAGSIASKELKEKSPSIEKQVRKDTEQAPVKAKNEVSHSIKELRQYTGDLTQKIADSIKP